MHYFISVTDYQTPSYEAGSCPGPNNITLELHSSYLLASPRYGISNYTNDLSCKWNITAPEGMVSGTLAFTWDVGYDLNMENFLGLSALDQKVFITICGVYGETASFLGRLPK